MKHPPFWSAYSRFLFRAMLKYRRLLPPKKSLSFGIVDATLQTRIGHICVINLSHQSSRLIEIQNELSSILDHQGLPLWSFTERYPAIDAQQFLYDPIKDADVDPTYTLGEQLFVEPQPLAIPTQIDLDYQIGMTRPEIAVAKSHIGVWRKLAESNNEYSLILEDDVWFGSDFTNMLDRAWSDLNTNDSIKSDFDILYLSYEEVKNGAPKTFLSNNLFCPIRGLWNLSGYVISRNGAIKLLKLLPCRGPIDLWINHQFKHINVVATKKSIINQRSDFSSTNSYSILPALTKIGAITSERAALFQTRPNVHPVFVFGHEGSGLTSIAMALAMLGYRCCSDLQSMPKNEYDRLFIGSNGRIFNAYVNVGSLYLQAKILKENFPQAKIIVTSNGDDWPFSNCFDYAVVENNSINKWQILCKYLRCAPPTCSFPELPDIGQRELSEAISFDENLCCIIPKRDNSPWVIELQTSWNGIHCIPKDSKSTSNVSSISVKDNFDIIDEYLWHLREDTFTDNLALFRPRNISVLDGLGLSLTVQCESLGLRNYSAASLTGRKQYLFGRFEATIKASNTPGVVTGFFLHRDSPRQEIDIEIAGHRTDILIVNVFYNPGAEGAKYDYGYRGAASHIRLGFDASTSYHHYSIEWTPTEIRWYVDNRLIHRRFDWNPTPIPQLPMFVHANLWPCRSTELAGRLNKKRLPATTFVKSISINATQYKTETYHEYSVL